MKKNKGFTLIELLVVIAIIGILASVVLAALGSARSKGKDAAIQSQVANARAQGELYYTTQSPNTYLGVCAALASANGLASIVAGINTSGGTATCNDTATQWAISSPLVSNTASHACADSTGYSASANPGKQAVGGLCS